MKPPVKIFSAARARAVNLVDLPVNIRGKKCGNCIHFDASDSDNGFCNHPKVMMSVNDDWACSEWENPGAVPVADPNQVGGLIQDHSVEIAKMPTMKKRFDLVGNTISRFDRRQIDDLMGMIDDQDQSDEIKLVAGEIVSRFSECGHTPDGDFDHGNTCASLRGKGGSKSESGSSQHHESRAKHHEERAAHHRKRADKLQEHALKTGSHYDSERAYQLSQRDKKHARHHENEASKHPREKSKESPAPTSSKPASRESEQEARDSKERPTGVTNNQVREWQQQVNDLRDEIDDHKSSGYGDTEHAKHLKNKMYTIYNKIVDARSKPGGEHKESSRSETTPDVKDLVDKVNDAHGRMKKAKSPEERKHLRAEYEGHLSQLDKAKKEKSGHKLNPGPEPGPKHEHGRELNPGPEPGPKDKDRDEQEKPKEKKETDEERYERYRKASRSAPKSMSGKEKREHGRKNAKKGGGPMRHN